jgi:hypothetical protein
VNVVSRFEANLLTIARCITGLTPLDEGLHVLRHVLAMPTCLSKTAIALLQETLAKGVVQSLATRGWPTARHLAGGEVRRGRLWERVPLEMRQLEFSSGTVRFLMWMTAEDMSKPATALKLDAAGVTLADALLMVMAYLTLEETPMAEPLAKQSPLQGLVLLRLLAPHEFLNRKKTSDDSWQSWLAPQRAWVLEAFQPLLARRWLRFEQAKQAASDRIALIRHSQRQHEILAEYLDALEAANRRDLARFLLVMGGRLLLRPPAEQDWFANLLVRDVRLSEREAAYRTGLLTVGEFERLRRWQQEATAIGYYDEGYAASQLVKADWETYRGEEVSAAAVALLRRYTSLKQWETVS